MMATSQAKEKFDYLGFTQGRWQALLETLGEKPYHVQQIMKWLHRPLKGKFVHDFSEMTDLSKSLRSRLALLGEIHQPEVDAQFISSDGTRKWLLRARSGSLMEMVFIPETSRGTLCVSSQVGCALNCSFCATGKQGFNSQLSAGEIIGQLRIAIAALTPLYPERKRVVTNVVMMGMGEPLLNTDNVLPAVNVMMDDLGYGISKRRVTISTAGLIPGIDKMCGATDASLAISLHAPDNALRDQLVPINRKYPIEELLQACARYVRGLGEHRCITIEYTLIDGVNDSLAQAAQVSQLLSNLACKINLIPFNPFPGTPYRRPSVSRVRKFQACLVNDGYTVTVRTTRGADIQAACGQLAGKKVSSHSSNTDAQQIAPHIAPQDAQKIALHIKDGEVA